MVLSPTRANISCSSMAPWPHERPALLMIRTVSASFYPALWYVASGEDFAPEETVPVPSGSFVRRIAKSAHYDGVRKGAAEPAIHCHHRNGPNPRNI